MVIGLFGSEEKIFWLILKERFLRGRCIDREIRELAP